jgi:hypothetical protein
MVVSDKRTSLHYSRNAVKHFIFLVTYKWAQQARVLYYTGLETLARKKLTSLLDPFISYEGSLKICEYSPGALVKLLGQYYKTFLSVIYGFLY